MHVDDPTVDRLVMLVQRLLDSEQTTEAQTLSLMEEATAVQRHWRAGNHFEAKRHAHRLELYTEALVRTEAVVPVDGLRVLAAARKIRGAISGSTLQNEETES